MLLKGQARRRIGALDFIGVASPFSLTSAVHSPSHTPCKVKLVALAVASRRQGCRNIRTRRSRRDRCTRRTSPKLAQRMAPTSSQMPSACPRSGLRKAPPHAPRASSWLPSQSQSPAWDAQNNRTRRSRLDRRRLPHSSIIAEPPQSAGAIYRLHVVDHRPP